LGAQREHSAQAALDVLEANLFGEPVGRMRRARISTSTRRIKARKA
jgi:hypothetical protein